MNEQEIQALEAPCSHGWEDGTGAPAQCDPCLRSAVPRLIAALRSARAEHHRADCTCYGREYAPDCEDCETWRMVQADIRACAEALVPFIRSGCGSDEMECIAQRVLERPGVRAALEAAGGKS